MLNFLLNVTLLIHVKKVLIKLMLYFFVTLFYRRGVVHFNAIMSLRNALDKLQQLKGLKSEEKGMLYVELLHVVPLMQKNTYQFNTYTCSNRLALLLEHWYNFKGNRD